MRDRHGPYNRALGVDPTSRGFGFAILERGERLVDWGTKQTPPRGRNAGCLEAVQALIRTYEPDVLALEDCFADGSRRCRRVQTLIQSLRRKAAEHTLPVRLAGPHEIRAKCAGNVHATKHELAIALTKRFPVLERRLPPRRKAWMSEDLRMGIFDAVALAVVAIEGATAASPRRRETRAGP